MINPIVNYNQQEDQEETIPVERNLTENALWLPNESRKVFECRTIAKSYTDENGKGYNFKIEVRYDPKLGTLTTFDQRVYLCLVELWYNQERLQVTKFSLRQLAEMLELKWSGSGTGKALEHSLIRLRGVLVHWNGAFFDFSQNKHIHIKNPFTVLNHLVIVSTNEKAIRDKECEFSFDSHVVNNFLNNGTRPINRKVIQSLGSPIAQQLYIMIDREMYGTNEYSILTANLFEKLGLTAKRYKYLSNRVELLQGFKSNILNKITSYNETFTYFEIEASKTKDKKLVVRRTGAKKIALSPEYLPRKLQVVPEIGSKTQYKASREAKRHQPIVKGGLEKDALRTQNKEGLQSLQKTIQPEPLPQPVQDFINTFCELFPKANRNTILKSKTVKKAISEFVEKYKEHSIEFLKYSSHLGKNPAYAELLNSNTPSRLFRYRIGDELVIDAWLRKIASKKQDKEKQQLLDLERRMDLWRSFELKHRDEFHEYVISVIESLSEEEKQRFNNFQNSQLVPPKSDNYSDMLMRIYFSLYAKNHDIEFLDFHSWAEKNHEEEYWQYEGCDLSAEASRRRNRRMMNR